MKSLPPLSKEAKSLKPGIYKHFKGNTYKALGIARHSETLEEFVVYEAEYGDHEVWVRPLAFFTDETEYHGTRIKRFTFLHE